MASDLTTCQEDLCSTIIALNQQILNGNPVPVGSIGHKKITWAVKSSCNYVAFVMDGELYTSSGNNGSYNAYQSGRGKYYIGNIGINNLKKLYIPNITGIKKTGISGLTSYVLFNNGELYVWGNNSQGQCGLGHVTDIDIPTLSNNNVLNVWGSEDASFNITHSRLFITKTDGLYSCGYNGYGQCGVNSTNIVKTWTKCQGFNNLNGTDILDLYVGGNGIGVTFILLKGGYLYACGHNGFGQLGDSTTTNSLIFKDITTIWAGVSSGITSMKISGGFGYSGGNNSSIFMLLKVGSTNIFKCCGNNTWGQLGNNTTIQQKIPIIPNNIVAGNIQDFAVFGGGPCTISVLYNNGDLYTWGYNNHGQCGNSTVIDTKIPTKVNSNVTKLLSNNITKKGASFQSRNFIQKADGLYVCGFNTNYDCGLGRTGNIITFTKILIPSYDNDVKFLGEFQTADSGHIIFIVTSLNNIYAWGYNTHYGVCSYGSNNDVMSPILINDYI